MSYVVLRKNVKRLNSNFLQTLKYKFLAKLIGKKDEEAGESDEERSGEDEKENGKSGEGIILPGHINGLLDQLKLVCAERAAGNIAATTPHLVAILDELLRRNYLEKDEYNAVCQRLEC